LVDRGWVEIRDHPDGRGVLLALTARGNEMLLHAVPPWKQAQEQAQSLVAETLLDLGAGKEAS
jgi:DNA-binding MarR family transcriptional regulator